MTAAAFGLAALFTAAALTIGTVGVAAIRAERLNESINLWPVDPFDQDTLPTLPAPRLFTVSTETDVVQSLRLVR